MRDFLVIPEIPWGILRGGKCSIANRFCRPEGPTGYLLVGPSGLQRAFKTRFIGHGFVARFNPLDYLDILFRPGVRGALLRMHISIGI